MTITVPGREAPIEDSLARLKDKIRRSRGIPDEKKQKLLRLWDGPDAWAVRPIPDALAGGLDGATIKYPGTGGLVLVRDAIVRRASIDDRQAKKRLDAVLFHELVHATGEGELDCEVLENLVFGGHGATPPDASDTGFVTPDGKLGGGPHGFSPPPPPPAGGMGPPSPPPDPWAEVHGDHFIWDPRTGKVWKKDRHGRKIKPPVIDGSDKRWRRPQASKRPDGQYMIGTLLFDPIRLRMTMATGKHKGADAPVTPHFVVSSFLALNAYEARAMSSEPTRFGRERLPLPVVANADETPLGKPPARKGPPPRSAPEKAAPKKKPPKKKAPKKQASPKNTKGNKARAPKARAGANSAAGKPATK